MGKRELSLHANSTTSISHNVLFVYSSSVFLRYCSKRDVFFGFESLGRYGTMYSMGDDFISFSAQARILFVNSLFIPSIKPMGFLLFA